MWATEALAKFLAADDLQTVLDIGSGNGVHAKIMRKAGMRVTEVDWLRGEDYNLTEFSEKFDGIWCSHVLEHQLDVNRFLRKIFMDLKIGGLLAVTVPPAKHEIVGGHVTLWNQGLLVYNLILAGFDCSEAKVSPVYDGYNISVLVRKREALLPRLSYDAGDIELLAEFWPCEAAQGFDGSKMTVRW